MSSGRPLSMEEMYTLLTDLQTRVTMLEEGRNRVHFRAPIRPREGMTVYADGTSWNPGSGAGMYEYKAGAWSKL